MKTNWMLLLIGTLAGVASAGAGLASNPIVQPMIVNLTGDLRIRQELPGTCNNVNQTTPVTQGQLEITPADGVDVPGGKAFVLTAANVSFAPFTIERHCMAQDEKREYTEVGVQLGRAVAFTATPSASGPGVFDLTIPKGDFLIYESADVVHNGHPGTETGYKYAKEDVTGTIDLVNGTVQMTVVVATKIHIKFGCVPVVGCAVNSDYNGTLTADLSGTILFPDADGDGVSDRADNCKFTANPTQAPVPTPVVTPPAALTINSCQDHQIGAASGSDVCDASFVSLTNNAPGTFNLGPNVVTWTGVDGKGRVGSATQNVTVVDTTKPIFTFVPGPIALNDCKAANLGVPTATDDCAGTPTFTNNAPAKFPVGPTVVTWIAKDVSNNMSTAMQTVTVTDTVAPTVACTTIPDPNDDDGGQNDDSDGVDGYFRVSSSDACAPPPTIRVGGFTLNDGEVVKLTFSRKKPGIAFVGTSRRLHIRHYRVGPGQGIITSTDGSSNVASANCVLPKGAK